MKPNVFCVFQPISPLSISFFHLFFSFQHLFYYFNALFPLCLPDGAAMRAGVQTGDRIIKVLCSSASMYSNCQRHCFFPKVNIEAIGCHLVVSQYFYSLYAVL